MDPHLSCLSPYEPPADDQMIVWVEDGGKPFIQVIYGQLFGTTARHATYQDFVIRVGKWAAETAVRLYRMEQEAA